MAQNIVLFNSFFCFFFLFAKVFYRLDKVCFFGLFFVCKKGCLVGGG